MWLELQAQVLILFLSREQSFQGTLDFFPQLMPCTRRSRRVPLLSLVLEGRCVFNVGLTQTHMYSQPAGTHISHCLMPAHTPGTHSLPVQQDLWDVRPWDRGNGALGKL